MLKLTGALLITAAFAVTPPVASAHFSGPLTGSGPAVPATPTAAHWTIREGLREILGYEHDGKWITGATITDCHKVARYAVRCTVTTPPITVTTDPSEIPQPWSWVDTAKPNPGPLWWNVVSSDPVGGIVLS